MKTTILILLSLITLSTGCGTAHDAHEGYKKTGAWTPDSFNYTLQRDRETGALSDYFGFSWSLK